MTERLDEHKMKYAVDTDKEAEDICRWAAARAGVIVVAPVVGTMTLMANEVYMITRLAKLRGIKLSESAVLGLLGSLGGAFVGQTLATLIPFAPVQIPVGMSVTYAVGKVANAWLEAGCPEDLSAFKTTYEEARIEGIKMLGELKNMACKDKPLGDESRRFEVDDDSPANKKVDDLLRKVKGVIILILIWRKPFQYNKKIVVSTIFFAQRLVHTNKDKMRIIKDVEKEENYEDCFCRKSQQWKDDHVQCTYRQE